ncbi:MAG: metallophosphoesterase [Alphaproteobacteria bacterium]|nr:metallophosphoesterase [Alphaproteobacteria bacterium]
MVLRNLAGLLGLATDPPTLPPGERVYAIGDIHGRLDLFHQLLRRIEADNAARGRADVWLILLGDLINRGPDSRGVIERALKLANSPQSAIFLMGNHEDMLLRVWRGQTSLAYPFLQAGGDATLKSYGYTGTTDQLRDMRERDIVQLVRSHVPEEHIRFLRRFGEKCEMGDYLFVHAGVRPGISIAVQSADDMRWIGEEFVHSKLWHGAMIIHAHHISDAPDVRPNRIGIDTGAYCTGTLTAIGLQGAERWFLAT